MSRRLRCPTHVLIAFVTFVGPAAAGASPPVPSVRPMYFEHLTMREGLSQSAVMSILQDSQGYLWLATESGLNRYDGNSIRKYRRERGNKQALASDYIWKIAEDSRGDLWFATVGGGVARWDRKTDRFQQFGRDPRNSDSLSSNAVRTLLIDAQGLVWIGTEQRGLNVLDPRSGRARNFRHREGDPRSLAADGVFAIHADRAGRIWVGTDRGLSRYEPATDDFVNFEATANAAILGNSRVRSILEDHTGALWVGTLDGGLHRLDLQAGAVKTFRHDADRRGSLSADRVLAILEDDARRLWVGTSDGLNLFDRRSETFVRYGRDSDNPHSLRDNDIMSLYQDRGGVLWVGTRFGGVSRWNPDGWRLGHYQSALTRNAAVNTFADNGAGHVWVGTSDGLIEIDTLAGRERRFDARSAGALRLADDRVMALLFASDQSLWIGTMAGGLARFDRGRASVRLYQHVPGDSSSLPADGVMSLLEDRGGDLWVGTFGGGLARIERETGRLVRYARGDMNPNALSNSRATAIAEDLHGNLWVGTAGGGLNLLERSAGKFHHYVRDDTDPRSLSDDTIYALHVDRDGTLWVGTAGGGLDRLIGSSARPREVRFEHSSSFSDVPSTVVYGIESGSDGELWLSTNSGLVRLDPRSGRSMRFGEVDGVQAEEFNFNAHHRSRDGTLYFGGSNGFNAFLPGAVSTRTVPPRVALTSVTILNRTLALAELPGGDRPLELAHDDKLVSFEFAALDFASPADNRYLYRLQGFDSQWVEAKGLPRATYTNLAAGDYVFEVRAANSDGVWSVDPLRVTVHVAAAPWNTLSARLLYLTLGLGVVAFVQYRGRLRRRARQRHHQALQRLVRKRTEQLEERNEQLQVLSRAKSDFVAQMNHELRTPMNGVLGMSELLLDMRLGSRERQFVESINQSASALLAIVNDVLDFSKIDAGHLQLAPSECDLVEIVEQAAEVLAPRAAAKDIELLCDCPCLPLPRVWADAVRLRQVLVNLGGNAVKFTEKGEVTLRLRALSIEEHSLRVRLEVIDTGVGIEPVSQARIFEAFIQADASTTRRFGGTGLGLAIARQLVELMGGRIALASTPGRGSTFSFEVSVPLADASAELRPKLPDLRGLRVLVVHSNAPARSLLTGALDTWGARPVGVASFADALLEMRVAACDVILIDDAVLAAGPGDCRQLQMLYEGRVAKPRIVRIATVANLARARLPEQMWFDVEIIKPIRLARVHDAVAGCELGDYRHRDASERRPQTPMPLNGRVLLVEDHPINREVAEGMLRALGLQVESASDGRQALDMLVAGRYDVVLMDCQMPVIDGLATTVELRRREGMGPRVPVIALTADTDVAAREACFAAGMDAFIGKPFTKATLRAALARWITVPGQDQPIAREQAG